MTNYSSWQDFFKQQLEAWMSEVERGFYVEDYVQERIAHYQSKLAKLEGERA